MQRFRISVDRPMRGLALHQASELAAEERDSGDVWICGVREKMQREEEVRQAMQATAAAIQHTLAEIAPQIEANLGAVTAYATQLGLAIAREVVGVAVDEGLLDPSEIVLRCLRQSVQGGMQPDLRIELSPEDLNHVISSLESSPELADKVGEVDFVANPNLERSCVQVSSQSGRMIYDPSEVLDRICEEIRKGAVA